MSIVDNGTGRSNSLVERVKGILLKPKEEWDRIDMEPATIQGLYTGYVCILAAIGPVATLIGGQLSFGFLSYRPGIVGAIVGALVSYIMSLVMVFVLGLIIENLAPTFDGEKNRLQAMKVAVYSMTPGWVAGAVGIFLILGFGFLPLIGLVAVLAGLYGIYLLYLGLPKLMRAPQERAIGYIVVTIIIAVLLSLLIQGVTRSLTFGAALGGYAAGPAATGVVSVGGTSVDLGKLQAASKQMEANAKQIEAATSGAAVTGTAGAVKVVPGETLKALLPEIGGYTRSEISSSTGGAAGIGGSNAEATYQKGSSSMTVEITDLGAAGGIAGLAGAFQVNSNKETATGYEKMGTVNGRMTTEEYNNQGKSGKYGVLVASRFMVEAHGNDVAMNDLKNVVGSIDTGRLESLAK